MFVIDKNLLPTAAPKIIFTRDIPGFIAWLETQDADTEYDHKSPTDCLICRFASFVSGKPTNFSVAGSILDLWSPEGMGLPFQRISYGPVWGTPKTSYDNTYRGALTRARALSKATQ